MPDIIRKVEQFIIDGLGTQSNQTPEGAVSQYQTIGTTHKADGFTVALVTCTPNGYSVSGYPAATNTLLRADFTVPTGQAGIYKANAGITYADYLIDLAADSRLTNNVKGRIIRLEFNVI